MRERRLSTSAHTTPLDVTADAGSTVAGSGDRALQIAALREHGHSLDEIAVRFGVSRERVRQILHAHGGPDRQQVAQARRLRAEQQVHARLDELLALWRAGTQPASAARALGLQASASRRAITRAASEADHAARNASLARARTHPRRYSDRDIIEAVGAVAVRLGRVPSTKDYVAARERDDPSLTTIRNRMNGWTNAVRAAGLPTAWTPARTRAHRWPVEACWAALREVTWELGEIPTVVGYERHSADRADLPSSATLRTRLGRWNTITTQLASERAAARHAQDASVRGSTITSASGEDDHLTSPPG